MSLRAAALASALFLALAAGPPARAAEPVPLDVPMFSVALTDANGVPRESFSRRTPPYFTISFALALSASSRYATRITLVHTSGEGGEESVLYEGNLAEGLYRLTVPAPVVEGDSAARIIFKTRVFPKKFTGESYYAYRVWEGSYRVGR